MVLDRWRAEITERETISREIQITYGNMWEKKVIWERQSKEKRMQTNTDESKRNRDFRE